MSHDHWNLSSKACLCGSCTVKCLLTYLIEPHCDECECAMYFSRTCEECLHRPTGERNSTQPCGRALAGKVTAGGPKEASLLGAEYRATFGWPGERRCALRLLAWAWAWERPSHCKRARLPGYACLPPSTWGRGLLCLWGGRVQLLPASDPRHHAIRELVEVGVDVAQALAHLCTACMWGGSGRHRPGGHV